MANKAAIERARDSLRLAIGTLDALGMHIAAAQADLALNCLNETFPDDGRSPTAMPMPDWPSEQ